MASYEERFEKGEKRKRARNWEVEEIVLLVQAKRNEWEKYESSNTRDRFESSSDKWKKIVEYLQAQGVQERDITQARMKWENIISDFKAIKDWNRRSGNAPFFTLTREERKNHNLPLQFDSNVYDLVDSFQGRRPSIVPQSITDTSSSKQQTEVLLETLKISTSQNFNPPVIITPFPEKSIKPNKTSWLYPPTIIKL
eukprot:Gb_04564 [translate_table: standard]